ncbi:hypothetical protein Mal4_02240 [Maioricimonas rarisocia]|uniref:Glycosyltransferase RgtA/B/C/D-like domain-containing protein n=1 Tax=Maioricimonas rarisocia TaxID=2528026 RepID=A0A517Z0C9_9PLAN|nr:glycosyltransferase family 39 protein [Maioricimonas rarisocia]QDU35942.1 hypothetical protein Mal4_02240 [Maioricimonas rarisocia]
MRSLIENRYGLFAILAIALLLRVAAAGSLQWVLDHRLQRSYLIEGDAEGYWELAGDVAHGRDYAIYTPPRRALRMPGFPALLAMPIGLFGESFLAARIWLAIIGTLACGLVYWLGRTTVDHTTGLIAAALCAVSPQLVGFTPLILSETAFAATLLASLVGCAYLGRWTNEPFGWKDALLATVCGGLFGLAVYIRPSWLLVAPATAALYVLLKAPRMAGILRGGLLVAAMLISLLPWGIRNHAVTGHFFLTTLWMGPSLYDGLNPEATGASDMTFFDRDQVLARGMSEYEMDQHYRQLAREYAFENPGHVVKLAFNKLARYWKPWPNAEQFRDWRLLLLLTAFFLPMITFSLVGAWQLRHQPWVLFLTGGAILYFSALHMVFVSSLRYRLPAEYPLMVLCACGLQRVMSGKTFRENSSN